MKRKWFTVEEYCACLVRPGGNPEKVEDRIAFIEKTPRVRVERFSVSDLGGTPATSLNGKVVWLSGPKGDGHECGAFQPSRDWCERVLDALDIPTEMEE